MSMKQYRLNSETQKSGNQTLRAMLRNSLPDRVEILPSVVGTWVHAGSLSDGWSQSRLVMNGATLAVGRYDEEDCWRGIRLTEAGIAYFSNAK